MNVDALKQIGSEWVKGDMHRIYFNNLCDLAGMKISFYGTGNISSASLDGVGMSNRQASDLSTALACSKIWYDVADGQFHGAMSRSKHFDIMTFFKKIVAEIERRAAQGE